MDGNRLIAELLLDRGAQIGDNDALVAASEGGLWGIVESSP